MMIFFKDYRRKVTVSNDIWYYCLYLIRYGLKQRWPTSSYVAQWRITRGAFHNKICQGPKAQIVDFLIRKVKNVLNFYGAYELVGQKIGALYIKGWPPLV